MFTSLRLVRFKSWNDTGVLRLAPITAFLGANSSGKTSLIQSLLLLRQTTESSDRNRVLELSAPNGLVDLGSNQDIMFRHEFDYPLEFGLAWETQRPLEVRDLLAQARKKSSTLISSNRFAFSTALRVEKNVTRVEHMSYTLGEATFGMARVDDTHDDYELVSDQFSFVRTTGRPWPLPHPSRFYGFPDQVRLYFQNAGFLSDLELQFEEACQRIRYLGPLREDPQRQYISTGGTPSDVGQRGELAVEALIASRLSGRRISRGWNNRNPPRRLPQLPVEEVIAQWLKELQLIESFDLEALDDRETVYRVNVRRQAGSVPVLITDVGFGVSQVLPVLVLLAHAEEGDTVLMEQPEIHLHPAVQAGLADIIIETALARGVQVVLETHSEHLLTRIQRRLAERKLARGLDLTADKVALYFCHQSEGVSEAKPLLLDDFGNILNWPRDFFGNTMEESVAMMEAGAVRRSDVDRATA